MMMITTMTMRAGIAPIAAVKAGESFGVDWDSDDAINGPYDGEDQVCPNCGGSGNAEDMTFW